MQERVCDSSSLFCWGLLGGAERGSSCLEESKTDEFGMNTTRCENNRLFAYNLVKMILIKQLHTVIGVIIT